MCSRWKQMDFTCSKVWLSDVFFVNFGQKGALWQEEDIMGLMHAWYSIIGFIYNWFGTFHVICWLRRKICPFKYSQRWMNMCRLVSKAGFCLANQPPPSFSNHNNMSESAAWVSCDRPFSQSRENSDPTSPESRVSRSGARKLHN